MGAPVLAHKGCFFRSRVYLSIGSESLSRWSKPGACCANWARVTNARGGFYVDKPLEVEGARRYLRLVDERVRLGNRARSAESEERSSTGTSSLPSTAPIQFGSSRWRVATLVWLKLAAWDGIYEGDRAGLPYRLFNGFWREKTSVDTETNGPVRKAT